jgi:ATP-dependent Clp protease ATP-binding subunit ClpB
MSSDQLQFTDRAANALANAASLAEQYRNSQILPIHLAVSLFKPLPDGSKDQQNNLNASTPLFQSVVERANGDPQLMDRALEKQLVRLPSVDPAPDHVSLAPALTKVIRFAAEIQKTQKDSFVAIDHLICALAQDSKIQAALKEANIPNPKLIESAIQRIRGTTKLDSKKPDSSTREYENLRKFTVDMTAMAREGRLDPVSGREEEIRQVIRILLKRTNRNPILIGEPGVGKMSIVAGLAHRIVNSDVPSTLADCQLLSLDLGLLVAGTKFYGEFEERLREVLKEIENSDEMIILVVDEIHLTGAETSNERGIDASYLFRLMFARGRSPCILATTLSGYWKLQKDAMVECRFQKIFIKEPTAEKAISMLRGLKERYEVYHGVEIRDSAIVTAVSLATRHLTTRRLPASAVELIDEAAADIQLVRETKPAEIDKMEHRLRQLEIEIRGLQRETLPDSVQRLELAKSEAAKMKEELMPLEAHHELDKEISKAKLKLDRLNEARDNAERASDLQTASDLMYYAIPDVKETIRRLKLEEEKLYGDGWNTDAVGTEQIIAAVARQTGIPITQLRVSDN